jgi:hypothetical protein
MEFGERVAEITHSDNFIDELSREIGVPRADETEQGFVERAKEAMASLLRTKLGYAGIGEASNIAIHLFRLRKVTFFTHLFAAR